MPDWLRITPLDVWMFRDGRPFNQGDLGARAAESLFPPPPPVIAGALRLGLAHMLGFDGSPATWPRQALGDGVDWQDDSVSLGRLSFGSVHLERQDQTGKMIRYRPAPAHLVTAGNPKDKTALLLCPSKQPAFTSDLDAEGNLTSFPVAPGNVPGVKPLEGAWVRQDAHQAILMGQAPSTIETAILRADDVMAVETRTGIAIDAATRRVEEGMIYTAGFVRLAENVRLAVTVNGLPEGFSSLTQRLGGEGRQARFERVHEAEPNRGGQAGAKTTDYVFVSGSPVFLDARPVPGSTIAGLAGTLVSAALPKPFWLGGWDSRPDNGPLPMREILPAGSVFFMRCTTSADVPAPGAGLAAGRATAWGFGQGWAGRWPHGQKE